MSGATTRAPSGSAAATGASSWDTVAPVDTSAASTPVIRAKAARDRSVASCHTSHEVPPTRQSASTRCRCSNAGSGGSP